MQLTITNADGDRVWSQEVDGSFDLGTIKMLSAADLGMNYEQMTLLVNGVPVLNDQQTLTAAGVKDGDVLQAFPVNAAQLAQQLGQRQQQQQQRNRPVDYKEKARELMRTAPRAVIRERWTALADAMDANDIDKVARMLEEQDAKKREEDARLARAEANPQDPENQRYLEERIRQQNVEESFIEAQENFPEMFGTVVMLYIDVKVNGVRVKAFVDSGAQMTIMSSACAERCSSMRLLDKRFAGIAKGVGTQKILGRVHLGQIQIGDSHIPQSFSVMEEQPMDLLIGLDLLKRHQCVIDLKNNCLTIGTTNQTVPFLSEGQLDAEARLSGPAAENAAREEMEIQKAIDASKTEQPSTSGAQTTTQQSSSQIQQVVSMTQCTPERASAALAQFNNDPNAAALSILTQQMA